MKNLEQKEQKLFVKWLNLKNIFHFAVKNESGTNFNGRGKMIGANDASMGKLKGVSDLIVMLDDGILFIEMKRPRKILKNGSKSCENLLKPEQKQFLDKVNNFKYAKGYACYGFDEAKQTVEAYLNDGYEFN